MLLEDGGLFTIDDLKEGIVNGEFQSFARDESWLVTQIFETPRKRVMNIILAFGEIDQLVSMESEVDEFARKNGVNLIGATARTGFEAFMTDGWVKTPTANYRKELV